MKIKYKNIIIFTFILFACQLMGQNSWKSLILPGLGENTLGLTGQSTKFMVAEASIWLCYFTFGDLGESYENDFRNHGIMHAEVNWDDKDDRFAANVGNYNSLQEYNEIKARDFLYNDMYPTDGNIDYNWNWESRKERLKYDTWRNKSKNYSEIKGFLVAGMLLNRLISIIDVTEI